MQEGDSAAPSATWNRRELLASLVTIKAILSERRQQLHVDPQRSLPSPVTDSSPKLLTVLDTKLLDRCEPELTAPLLANSFTPRFDFDLGDFPTSYHNNSDLTSAPPHGVHDIFVDGTTPVQHLEHNIAGPLADLSHPHQWNIDHTFHGLELEHDHQWARFSLPDVSKAIAEHPPASSHGSEDDNIGDSSHSPAAQTDTAANTTDAPTTRRKRRRCTPDTVTSQESVATTDRAKHRRPHVVVEQRYRSGLQTRFKALEDCVASWRARDQSDTNAGTDGSESSSKTSTSRKTNKASVFADAVLAISELKRENEELFAGLEAIIQEITNGTPILG